MRHRVSLIKLLEHNHHPLIMQLFKRGSQPKGNIMKILKTLTLLFVVFSITGTVIASDSVTQSTPTQYTLTPDSIAETGESSNFNNSIIPYSFKKVNLSCGLPPLPPIGCQVGACVCDQNGNNCQWTFICN